jgi:excisionase family DNA binding protein
VPTPEHRVVLTIEEAAQRLGIGRTTMYALIKTGQIRTVTIGRLRRIPTFCLDEYVRSLLTDPLPLDRAA